MEDEHRRMTHNLFVAMVIFVLIFLAIIFISGDGNGQSGARAGARARIERFIDSNIVYAPSLADTTIPKVKTVLSHLVSRCEGIQMLIYHEDIDSMDVNMDTLTVAPQTSGAVSDSDSNMLYGWERYLEVSFIVRKAPVTSVAKEYALAGDTLGYILGAGKTPGMVALRREGTLLCESEPEISQRRDNLISIPEFAVIDSL